MTLTNLEKRMLICVLDLFDPGGGGAEAPKAPPPPNWIRHWCPFVIASGEAYVALEETIFKALANQKPE